MDHLRYGVEWNVVCTIDTDIWYGRELTGE